MSGSVFKVVGAPGSPYTRKLRAVLRYRRNRGIALGLGGFGDILPTDCVFLGWTWDGMEHAAESVRPPSRSTPQAARTLARA